MPSYSFEYTYDFTSDAVLFKTVEGLLAAQASIQGDNIAGVEVFGGFPANYGDVLKSEASEVWHAYRGMQKLHDDIEQDPILGLFDLVQGPYPETSFHIRESTDHNPPFSNQKFYYKHPHESLSGPMLTSKWNLQLQHHTLGELRDLVREVALARAKKEGLLEADPEAWFRSHKREDSKQRLRYEKHTVGLSTTPGIIFLHEHKPWSTMLFAECSCLLVDNRRTLWDQITDDDDE